MIKSQNKVIYIVVNVLNTNVSLFTENNKYFLNEKKKMPHHQNSLKVEWENRWNRGKIDIPNTPTYMTTHSHGLVAGTSIKWPCTGTIIKSCMWFPHMSKLLTLS